MTGAGISGSLSGAGASGVNTAAASPVRSASRLTTKQQAALAQLSATDRHVRAHEQAHLAAAGPYALGGPSYSYTVGPDGRMYAVGGEVSLDVAPDPSDPKKTIEKERAVEAAANAPADPSSQDRRVAAQAAQMEHAAELQLAEQRRSGTYGQPDSVDVGQFISEIL